MSTSLFDSSCSVEVIELPDARLHWYPAFLDQAESRRLLTALVNDTPWRQDRIRMRGKVLDVPRLQAWYGERRARYAYSGLTLDPLPFTDELLALKSRVEQTVGHEFNSVLLNYYRDGRDSVSWHSDDEKELGPEPVIASLSLGCPRRFELKHRTNSEAGKKAITLTAGSLLLMDKGMQQRWQHRIPKQHGVSAGRINLTFRLIH